MFKGKKVRLRAYCEDDVEVALNLIEEDGIKELLHIGVMYPYSLDMEKNFVKTSMNPTGECFNFAIERNEEKDYIGGCGINKIDRKNSIAEIGIWLGKDFHGKGYGADALRLLCSFIFNELNVNKIKLNYFEFNDNARKCYDAVGFKPEGILRKEIYRYGRYSDVIAMGLFRNELKI
nr:GNAT family protein [uncultured Cetobacterium sp.]